MKKLLLLLMFLIGTKDLSAQTYTAQQEQLRSEISSYLSQRGYSPERQNDGLKFKSDGNNYYIEIDKDEKSPMYIRFARYVKYNDNITLKKIANNLNDYNGKYAVKVAYESNYAIISSELFVSKSKEFTDIFPKLLEVINSNYNLIKE